MKILFIYPAIGITDFNNKIGGEYSWIGHGICSVATCAQFRGHTVKIIDLRTLNSWEEFKNELIKSNPDLIGISMSYLDYKPALNIWSIIQKSMVIEKKINHVPVIVGGIFPTLFPEKVADEFDLIIKGEGEVFFDCLSIEPVEYFTGISNIIAYEKPNLDFIPYINRELFPDYSRELNCTFAPNHPKPHITMIAGRGCPMACHFCQPAERAVFGDKFRMRSVDHVIGELKELREKYQFKSITWWDDTFTVNPKWIDEFCNKYELEGFKAEMVACSRADIICNNEPMIKRLSEIGLNWLVIGLESGNQRILDFLHKGTTVEQNYKAAEICRKYGIKVFGTFMFGLPTETNQEVMDTVRMIRTIKPEHPSPFYFTPIPGTYIYDYCTENKLLLRDDPFEIERTNNWSPKIKGIDYNFLDEARNNLL